MKNDFIVTIQAVTEREQNVKEMLKRLPSGVRVHYDTDRISPLHSFVQMLDIEFTDYRLHLQDDVILPQGFKDYLPTILKDMKERNIEVLSLFAPRRKKLKELYKAGETYVKFNNFLWLQAVIFSKEVIDGIKRYIKHCKTFGIEYGEGKHDDILVREYLKENKKTAYCHLPSLVQHNTYMKSTMSHANSIQRASDIYDLNYIKKQLN